MNLIKTYKIISKIHNISFHNIDYKFYKCEKENCMFCELEFLSSQIKGKIHLYKKFRHYKNFYFIVSDILTKRIERICISADLCTTEAQNQIERLSRETSLPYFYNFIYNENGIAWDPVCILNRVSKHSSTKNEKLIEYNNPCCFSEVSESLKEHTLETIQECKILLAQKLLRDS